MCWDEFLEYWQDDALKGEVDGRTHTAVRLNPSCGDYVRVNARVVNDIVVSVRHVSHGCVLCQAAAAYLCHRSIGMDARSAVLLEIPLEFEITPMRQKCLHLSLECFRDAIGQAVPTEGEQRGTGSENPSGDN